MKIDYTALGKRIAKRRKELGLKQYEVCELIDVNYKYLSNIETGRSAPSLRSGAIRNHLRASSFA